MLQTRLRAGTYRLSECWVVQGRERRSEMWCAMDALVLKALALVLTTHLRPQLSSRCFHLAGTGGLKGVVLEMARQTVERCVAGISPRDEPRDEHGVETSHPDSFGFFRQKLIK